MKRLIDILAATTGLILLSPLLLLLAGAIWLADRRSPLYLARRVGLEGRPFQMAKFRTMVVGADRTGVDSTAADDPRITTVGHWIRRHKLDELPQLWNVLVGEMSIVGPRPNVPRETANYTVQEQDLLSVRPGMTDIASIVFADEAEIFRGSDDPDLHYNQLVRPWKSRLGLLYVREGGSLALDLRLVWLTLMSGLNREHALRGVSVLVARLGGDQELQRVAGRREPLRAAPPPGAEQVVQAR